MNIKRIGLVNWDAALPDSTYFGHYMLNSLGNEKYEKRLPFFAKKTKDGYFCPLRTQEAYDQELQFAIDGGVDFFYFCWYPENTPRTIGKELYPFLDEHYAELNYARKLYQKSKLNKKIGMCAIVFDISAYAESDIDGIVAAMKEDYYEKTDGRPLVVLYLNVDSKQYNGAVARRIKEKAAAVGINPYFALIADLADGEKFEDSLIDAVTRYGVGRTTGNYEVCLRELLDTQDQMLRFNKKVIPVLSVGWNPTPRIDYPSPWAEYYKTEYPERYSGKELRGMIENIDKWVGEHSETADTGKLTVFAWNEFEEGGWLCPTLSPDGTPDTKYLKGFADAVSIIKTEKSQ